MIILNVRDTDFAKKKYSLVARKDMSSVFAPSLCRAEKMDILAMKDFAK